MSNIRGLIDYEWGRTSLANNDGTKNNRRNEPYLYGMLKLSDITLKSFTAINLILIWVLFLIVQAIKINSETSYWCILYQFGAKYMPAIKYNYEFYRYLMPNFLHSGFVHILSNSIGLFLYGFVLERAYGVKKFAILYILSCLGGNLLSCAIYPDSMSVGASSSGFGLFAFMILYLIENRDISNQSRMIYICYILLMIALSLDQFSSVLNQNIRDSTDHAAHIGGFLTGAFISGIYHFQNHQQKKKLIIKYLCYFALIISQAVLFVYNQTNENVIKPDYLIWSCV